MCSISLFSKGMDIYGDIVSLAETATLKIYYQLIGIL